MASAASSCSNITALCSHDIQVNKNSLIGRQRSAVLAAWSCCAQVAVLPTPPSLILSPNQLEGSADTSQPTNHQGGNDSVCRNSWNGTTAGRPTFNLRRSGWDQSTGLYRITHQCPDRSLGTFLNANSPVHGCACSSLDPYCRDFGATGCECELGNVSQRQLLSLQLQRSSAVFQGPSARPLLSSVPVPAGTQKRPRQANRRALIQDTGAKIRERLALGLQEKNV